MTGNKLIINQIYQGNCIDILNSFPEKSIDLIFADPPYNLQLQNELFRPNQSQVDGVNDPWDQFSSFEEYDKFTHDWLFACKRVLKDTGTIWVIGSYHNIFRVGTIMLNLGYWILNDVIWYKTNPMPNFRGTRFTNATETLIWAKKSKDQKKYTFNYHTMKNLNEEKQMQNVWYLPLCTGKERVKENGKKVHSTQKPESLLYRVVLSSSNPEDIILDPFLGSGTTVAVAKKLHRNFIGIEIEKSYIEIAKKRLDSISFSILSDDILSTWSKRNAPRVSIGQLIEADYLKPGQNLFSKDRRIVAMVKADSKLIWGNEIGSIHRIAAQVLNKTAYNGWDFWYYENDHGDLVSIDELRNKFRVDCDSI